MLQIIWGLQHLLLFYGQWYTIITMATVRKKERFEDTFTELEKIVDEFEKGEVDLEEGLKKFERGLELAKICKERLKEVENKVIQIKKKFEQE